MKLIRMDEAEAALGVRSGIVTWDFVVDVPEDRLRPWHTYYVEEDGWKLAHPLECRLDTCLYHEEAMIRGVPLLSVGAYRWDDVDDPLEEIING